MTRITAIAQGEITRFDPEQHGAEALARRRLLAVGAVIPSTEVFPGLQNHAAVDNQNQPQLELVGVAFGDTDLYKAAGHIVQQIAYWEGLPPGHAGINHSALPEVLASRPVQEAMALRANGQYVGYFCLTDMVHFEQKAGADFAGMPFTRHTRPVTELVGLTVGDVATLLGPGGVEGLRDPVDHPVVRQHLLASGLRPEILGS